MSDVLSFDEFRAHVASELQIDPAVLGEQARFHDDLEFDSIQMFLMLIAVEDLGVELPEDLLPHLVTVGDAFHYYVTKSQHH